MTLESKLTSEDREVNFSWEAIIRNERHQSQDVIFTAVKGTHRVSQTANILDFMLEEAVLPKGAKRDLVNQLDAIALERGWPAKLERRLATEPEPEPYVEPIQPSE